MKKLIVALVLLLSGTAFSQHTFDLKDASNYFDVKVSVEKCDDMYCSGKAVFMFYKKGGTRPFQVISLPDTQMQLDESSKPLTNVTMLYDNQSAVNVGDYNFDGMEDIALCDGANGSYGSPSYRVYLSAKASKKFVYNPAFTALGKHLGMFTVNKEKKTIETFDKSGCCWHITERYDVVAGKPRKVFEEVEDATIQDDTKVKITTKTIAGGKWKTSVKYVKRED
jgi:hypothetical protein